MTEVGLPEIATLRKGDPLRWLRLGWRDFVRTPSIGLFYGACFAAMGLAIAWAFVNSPQWLLAMCGGFLLLGPFLAIGLYDVSRSLERGEVPSLAKSLTAWNKNLGALGLYMGVLLVLEMLWSRAALVVFALSFNSLPQNHSTIGLLLDPKNIQFVATYFGGVCRDHLCHQRDFDSHDHGPRHRWHQRGHYQRPRLSCISTGDASMGRAHHHAGGVGHASLVCWSARRGAGARACILACVPGGGAACFVKPNDVQMSAQNQYQTYCHH
jgi:hypothetical protein